MNCPRGMQEQERLNSLHCAVHRSLPTFLVCLSRPNMTKRDSVVADIGRVQHVESFHLSAKRRNETDSGFLLGHDGNRGAQGGSFLTVNLECRGQ